MRLVAYFDANLVFLANLQVIWAIGFAMVVLAALVHLPQRAIFAIGALIVCGHNLLDGITVPVWSNPTLPEPTALAKLWMVLHQGGFFPLFGFPAPVVRLQLPGAAVDRRDRGGLRLRQLVAPRYQARRRGLVLLSVAMILVFLTLRIPNLYGDNLPWHPQDTLLESIGSFMNVQKYPPSLLYLLVTLAPCLLLLSYLDGRALPIR